MLVKQNKKKLSKRTLALAAVAVLLFASGGFMGTRAQLSITSQDYEGHFKLDHLQVHLIENGRDVCDGHNTLDGTRKNAGELIQYLKGKFDPGRAYKEEIAARNGTGENNEPVDQFVRLSIRKYWKNPEGEKDPSMDPDLIELTYNAATDKSWFNDKNDKAYNDKDWVINPKETTEERTTYYYRTTLAGGVTSAPVVNKLKISDEIVKDVKTHGPDADGVITYEFKYDGYIACIEADVQAVQTHNADGDADYAAIRSIWGVDNVFVSGDTLSVR